MANVAAFEGPSNRLDVAEQDHRISNSLAVISSLVRLKATHAKVDDVRQILLDVAVRIETVARLHRLLASTDITGVPLRQFLEDVCEAMKSIAADDNRFDMSIECAGELTVPPDKALRLGLLTAELFSNSIKYAHPTGVPTIIKVACREEVDRTIAFSFEDDGVGFPVNFDPTRHDSLGMKILDSLCAQLRGRSEWQDLGIGLRFVCRFPYGATEALQ
jgi:two-component sensor histidine kinase